MSDISGVHRPSTKADSAYQALRRAIVVGDVPANVPLDDAELAARYATGRTPVREALKRLALEQFVVWPPRRTPYVRDLSLHDLQRLYESRLVIETRAARLAATRITGQQLDEVERLASQLREAAERRETYEAVELDHELHLAVTQGSDNRFLTEAVGHLNCGSLRLWYVAHERLGLEDVPADHDDITRALRGGDPDRAEKTVREHILLSHEKQMQLQSLPTNQQLLSTD